MTGTESAVVEVDTLLGHLVFERLTAAGRGGTVEALSAARKAAGGFAIAR